MCLVWYGYVRTGTGILELSNPSGRGREKTANAPSSINTVTFFSDRTVK